MLGSLRFAAALLLALGTLSPGVLGSARANDRTLPMRFDLREQGPAEICGTTCATWIEASGAITADSGRDFARFIKGRALQGAVVVLDSDGGSVHGAIDLGREIRKAGLATTVGRIVDLTAKNGDKNAGQMDGGRYIKDLKRGNTASVPRATLSPRADCESMCAFVLLGGQQRIVPPEARVMVHQIWLGDRRDDPTAATYSAEDLVLVQRDIGRLAQFTAEMGGSIDLLDLALRIPPWEPLHTMTREEIRATKLATGDAAPPKVAAATGAVSPAAMTAPVAPMTDEARTTPISEQRWAVVAGDGAASLARRHPLTMEGDSLGSFDLMVACGANSKSFDLSYVERRHGAEGVPLAGRLGAVSVRVGRTAAKLRVESSERSGNSGELVSHAAATVPLEMIRDFASAGNHSMVIETTAKGMVTVIRIGNTGAQQSLPGLMASCGKPMGDRAEAVLPKEAGMKTGGMAPAQ